MLRALVVGILVLSACSGGGEAGSQPVATPNKDAGKVVEVTGNVMATNGGTMRALAVGNPVAADDVIDTQKDGSIVIELFHNNARWSLESGIKTRVDESVAWGMAKQEAAKAVDHATSAAGRHADRQAADTAVTATEKNATPPTPTKVETPTRPTTGEGGEREKDPPKGTEKNPDAKKDSAAPKDPSTSNKPSGCDEVQCAIDPNAACCIARRKPNTAKKPGPPPEKPPAEKPPAGDVPETLGRADIQTAMQQVKPKIMACGQKHGVTGTIKLTIKIAPDGRVSSVTVKQTPDQKVDACVIDAAKTLKLPKSVNGITFTYPIIL